MRGKTIALLFWCLVAMLASPMPGPGEQQLTFKGSYRNSTYGYSVALRPGTRGTRTEPPAPEHGFGITLNKRLGDYLWVNAEYDVLALQTAEGAARHEMNSFSSQYKMSVLQDIPTALGGADARDVILANGSGTGQFNYIHFLLAYRPVAGQPGIIYLVGLRQKARSSEAERMLSDIVRSFRFTKLPE
jgi:hypothetical protein